MAHVSAGSFGGVAGSPLGEILASVYSLGLKEFVLAEVREGSIGYISRTSVVGFCGHSSSPSLPIYLNSNTLYFFQSVSIPNKRNHEL